MQYPVARWYCDSCLAKRKHIMTLKAKFSAAVAIVLASLALNTVPAARADSLLPGGTLSPAPSVISVQTGPLLANTGALPFSFVGDTGTVSEIVFTDLATGNLDFVYQVSVATGVIGALTGYNFAGFTTNVGYGTPANLQCAFSISCSGTVAPSSIASSADGSVISFNFNPNVSGAITYALEIRTNASSYTTGSIGLIDGGGATLNGYAPASVPEPSSMLLLGAGLLLTPLLGIKRSFARG